MPWMWMRTQTTINITRNTNSVPAKAKPEAGNLMGRSSSRYTQFIVSRHISSTRLTPRSSQVLEVVRVLLGLADDAPQATAHVRHALIRQQAAAHLCEHEDSVCALCAFYCRRHRTGYFCFHDMNCQRVWPRFWVQKRNLITRRHTRTVSMCFVLDS